MVEVDTTEGTKAWSDVTGNASSYTDIFTEQFAKDLGLINCQTTRNSGKGCVVGCACNTANGWYPTAEQTESTNYVKVKSKARSYNYDASGTKLASAAPATCYHAASNCDEENGYFYYEDISVQDDDVYSYEQQKNNRNKPVPNCYKPTCNGHHVDVYTQEGKLDKQFVYFATTPDASSYKPAAQNPVETTDAIAQAHNIRCYESKWPTTFLTTFSRVENVKHTSEDGVERPYICYKQLDVRLYRGTEDVTDRFMHYDDGNHLDGRQCQNRVNSINKMVLTVNGGTYMITGAQGAPSERNDDELMLFRLFNVSSEKCFVGNMQFSYDESVIKSTTDGGAIVAEGWPVDYVYTDKGPNGDDMFCILADAGLGSYQNKITDFSVFQREYYGIGPAFSATVITSDATRNTGKTIWVDKYNNASGDDINQQDEHEVYHNPENYYYNDEASRYGNKVEMRNMCAHYGYSATSLGTGVCKEVDLGPAGICYDCIDTIYFETVHTIADEVNWRYDIVNKKGEYLTNMPLVDMSKTLPYFPTTIKLSGISNNVTVTYDSANISDFGNYQGYGYVDGTTNVNVDGKIVTYIQGNGYTSTFNSGTGKMKVYFEGISNPLELNARLKENSTGTCSTVGLKDSDSGYPSGTCIAVSVDGKTCYKCIDKIYFTLKSTGTLIALGGYSYKLYAGDTEATADNGFSIPEAAGTQPDFPTSVALKDLDGLTGYCSVTLAVPPTQNVGYDTGSGSMTFDSTCVMASTMGVYVSSYSKAPEYSRSFNNGIGSLTYYFANGSTINLKPRLTPPSCSSLGPSIYDSVQSGKTCTLVNTDFGTCYQCVKNSSGTGTGTGCADDDKVFFITVNRITNESQLNHHELMMSYALGCYTNGTVKLHLELVDDRLADDMIPVYSVGFRSTNSNYAPYLIHYDQYSRWVHERYIEGSTPLEYPPYFEGNPPDCAEPCRIDGPGGSGYYSVDGCSGTEAGYVKSTQKYTFTTTSGRTLSLPVMMYVKERPAWCSTASGRDIY